MKISVNSKALANALQITNSVISSNPVLPCLEDVLLEKRGKTLSVTATDLEISIIVGSIEAVGDENFIALVPAKPFLDVLKKLPNQPITIEKTETIVKIITANGKYELGTAAVTDFPNVPKPEKGEFTRIGGDELRSKLAQVLTCVGNDDLRMAMTGVHFNSKNGHLQLEATDAHRMAIATFSDVKLEASCIVPKKALNILKNTNGEVVHALIEQNNIFFNCDNITIVSRVIDARYPDVAAVIPSDIQCHIKAKVNKSDFLSSLKRVISFSNQVNNYVALEFSAVDIFVKTENLEYNTSAAERVEASCSDNLTIGFNAKLLIEMLSAYEAPTDEIRILMSNPKRAAVIKTAQSDVFLLAMPVMLTN